MTEAPRAFNRHIYHQKDQVFYGTDDGNQDGSFSEFPAFVDHYNSVGPERQKDIHMISVVGGLYGLNMIPLWKPTRITIFDINPMAISYFKVIRRLFTSSDSKADFLDRCSKAEYEVDDEDEEFIRENIRLKMADQLPRSRGSSKRSFEQSWQYALEHFELTKQILTEVPLEIRTEPMESESFSEMIRNKPNLWIYPSNITEFHYFDLQFNHPENCVIVQIIFPGKPQLLDLANYSPGPTKVNFHIPLSAERID